MRIRSTIAVVALVLLAGTGAVLYTAGGTAPENEPTSARTEDHPERPVDDQAHQTTPSAPVGDNGVPTSAHDTDPSRPDDSAHEILTGTGDQPDPDGPPDPIGEIDPSEYLPEGLDITAFPNVHEHDPSPDYKPTVGGPDAFSAGPGCAYQCIISGVAYPRGFGAELVVKTKVPADLWLSVIADTNGDGDWDYQEQHSSPSKETTYSWALDDLEPGQTYYAMVAATDEYDDTSHSWGEFTTLSTRTVEVGIDNVEIMGGPTNVNGTYHHLRFEGSEFQSYNLGAGLTFEDVDRYVDVELGVFRSWPGKICEGLWTSLLSSVYGDSDASCASWNTARAFSVDLDGAKPVASRWTSNDFTAVAVSPEGVGASAPRWFDVAAYVNVHVTFR
jgi:hypothetical protein